MAPIQNMHSSIPPPPLLWASQMKAFPWNFQVPTIYHYSWAWEQLWVHYTSQHYPHAGGYSPKERGFKQSVWSSGWRILHVCSEPTWALAFNSPRKNSIVTKKLLMTLTSKIMGAPAKPFFGRDRPGNQDELVCARCLQINPSLVPG